MFRLDPVTTRVTVITIITSIGIAVQLRIPKGKARTTVYSRSTVYDDVNVLIVNEPRA